MHPLHPAHTVQLLNPRTLLAFLAGVGLYTGVALRNPALVFLGATSLMLIAVGYWRASRLLRDLEVRRTHQPRTFEGQQVPVTLEIRNATRVRHSLLLVEDNFPPGDTWRMQHLLGRPVDARSKAAIHYTGSCDRRRGLYTLGPVFLEACDPLGLFRKKLGVEEFTFLLVYPTAVNLTMAEVLGDGTLAHVGIETTERAGASTEFIGVRPYRIGDSPNAIHWRSTARAGELIVMEFQETMTTQVTFFLDLGRMGLTGLGDQTSVEYAIKATASLARRAIEKNHLVQLFAVGREIEHTPLGGGARHLLAILDQLAMLKSEGEAGFARVVLEHLPLLAPGGTVFLVVSATMLDYDQARLLIDTMRRRRLLPVIVLIDDRAFVKLFREQETLHGEARPLEVTARLLILEGARVHLVTKARSPEQALVQGLDREYLAEEVGW